VDSAAFADKDFKMLTAQFGAEEDEEAPDASEDTQGDSPEENKEA
jgi:hypothetical protein